MGQKIEVLISGAGPTGLLAACELARAGVSFRVVDKQAAFSNLSRALAVQARTLEIFQQMGIVEKALENGQTMRGIILLTDRVRATIELKTSISSISSYPFVLILPQDKTERLLADELNRLGGAVEWNTEVLSVTQDQDSVRATVRGPNGEETIEASYIIGADGAHSVVRHQMQIEFRGAPYGQTFYLTDVAIDWKIPTGYAVACPATGDFNAFFPMPGNGRYRVLGILPEKVHGQKLDLNLIQSILNEKIPEPLRISDPRWMSEYHLHHRFATSFRKGRAFLCGDAGHIHSPAGGQGMNTGLQDAHNLAWKLAAVLKNKASEKLLDSYEQERLPVAKNLVEGTDKAFTAMTGDGPLSIFLRTRVLPRIAPLILSMKAVQNRVFGRLSQTRIQYDSILTSTPSPLTGKRFPHALLSSGVSILSTLCGTSFHLVVIKSGSQVAISPEALQKVWPDIQLHAYEPDIEKEVCKALGMRSGMVLVRPDQYVAFSSSQFSLELLTRYFSVFHA
ncbi:MAG: FAD-dependent monooxygenase [Leptospirales bacterium]|nr:FAD-dependent monooxygenase [Leptospirales bacterium]